MDSSQEDDSSRVCLVAKTLLKSKHRGVGVTKTCETDTVSVHENSNPIMRQRFWKNKNNVPILERRYSSLKTHDLSSNIVNVIFPKIHSTKNVAAASCEDSIITPFAQILLKLRQV